MTMAHLELDWLTDAFFDTPEATSLDGGDTDHGPLWHAITPRWGHAMNSMCSYHGMFPPRLAHYFVQRYSKPGDLVLDPFSGRGTTPLQARVADRRVLSNDLNPLAYVLTAAKSDPPSWEQMGAYISRLERGYKRRGHPDIDVSKDIRMLYHDNTLGQLLYLRESLQREPLQEWSPVQLMLAGAIAGILHGACRSDGTSMYLSISMPNTFSMPPRYVERFIREKGLKKPDQDVFARLREKLARIYLDSIEGSKGRTFNVDAGTLLNGRTIGPSSVDLVVTSPPYLNIVNYGTSNWIRLWWLGIDGVSTHGGVGRKALDSKLDHRHTYDRYRAFMFTFLKGVRRVLCPDGVAVVVIGDVASSRGTTCELAERVWSDIGEETRLRLDDLIEDSLPTEGKVSRIWGETRGRATDQECVLLLSRADGKPRGPSPVDWDEPYKDGGPDEAHLQVRRRIRES